MVVLTEEMVLNATKAKDLSNVKKLNCWALELTDVSIVQSMPNVQLLSLSVNKISSLEAFSRCPSVEAIYMRKNCVQDINEIKHLVDLPNLRSLWLAENPCAESSNYRSDVIRLLPKLLKLDNIVIDEEERQRANEEANQGDTGGQSSEHLLKSKLDSDDATTSQSGEDEGTIVDVKTDSASRNNVFNAGTKEAILEKSLKSVASIGEIGDANVTESVDCVSSSAVKSLDVVPSSQSNVDSAENSASTESCQNDKLQEGGNSNDVIDVIIAEISDKSADKILPSLGTEANYNVAKSYCDSINSNNGHARASGMSEDSTSIESTQSSGSYSTLVGGSSVENSAEILSSTETVSNRNYNNKDEILSGNLEQCDNSKNLDKSEINTGASGVQKFFFSEVDPNVQVTESNNNSTLEHLNQTIESDINLNEVVDQSQPGVKMRDLRDSTDLSGSGLDDKAETNPDNLRASYMNGSEMNGGENKLKNGGAIFVDGRTWNTTEKMQSMQCSKDTWLNGSVSSTKTCNSTGKASSNLLQATLCLINELDLESLAAVSDALNERIESLKQTNKSYQINFTD